MSAYEPPVSIRKLFAMLIALAVLFAPGVTGAAMAASTDHQMQMMQGGHCNMPMSGKSDHDKMGGQNCCISMCMAVAIAPSTSADVQPLSAQITQFALARTYHGTLAEIATPPPRLA